MESECLDLLVDGKPLVLHTMLPEALTKLHKHVDIFPFSAEASIAEHVLLCIDLLLLDHIVSHIGHRIPQLIVSK